MYIKPILISVFLFTILTCKGQNFDRLVDFNLKKHDLNFDGVKNKKSSYYKNGIVRLVSNNNCVYQFNLKNQQIDTFKFANNTYKINDQFFAVGYDNRFAFFEESNNEIFLYKSVNNSLYLSQTISLPSNDDRIISCYFNDSNFYYLYLATNNKIYLNNLKDNILELSNPLNKIQLTIKYSNFFSFCNNYFYYSDIKNDKILSINLITTKNKKDSLNFNDDFVKKVKIYDSTQSSAIYSELSAYSLEENCLQYILPTDSFVFSVLRTYKSNKLCFFKKMDETLWTLHQIINSDSIFRKNTPPNQVKNIPITRSNVPFFDNLNPICFDNHIALLFSGIDASIFELNFEQFMSQYFNKIYEDKDLDFLVFKFGSQWVFIHL